MVTKEELREKPVLLELKLGGCEDKLQWLINDEPDYSKLEKMSAKDVVEYMANTDSIYSYCPNFAEEIKSFLFKCEYYSINLPNKYSLVCACSLDTKEVHKDDRLKPILDTLLPLKTEDNQNIWYQELTLAKPFW